MFGFSLQKLLVFVAAIAAIWGVLRLVRDLERARRRAAHTARERESKSGSALALEMKECPVCHTYLSVARARDCGKARCPYPA